MGWRCDRPRDRPCQKRQDGARQHNGHKIGCHCVGNFLNRRTAALSGGHHRNDAGKDRVAADLVSHHEKCTGLVERASDHRIARLLFNRHRFAGEHRFLNRAPAFDEPAVHGDFLTRTHSQRVATHHCIQRYFFFVAIPHHPCHRWCQRQEFPNGTSRTTPGPQLQQLPQEHQRDDHCGGLKIDRHRPIVPQLMREKGWEKDGHNAGEIGGTGADGDEREHVEVPRHDRLCTALKKRPSAPEHHRRCENQLEPHVEGVSKPAIHWHAEHGQHRNKKHGHGQRRGHNQPLHHSLDFVAVFGRLRLKDL